MIITTSHGEIHTPVFMPVGTNATVKSLTREDLESVGAQIILSNNYHLYLRPGGQTISDLGGLHKFMNWPHPILTDSGGFQVFSLSKLIAISEDGINFTSHIDGSKHFWTPEDAIRHQFLLGSDIIMPLDIATPHAATHAEAKKAMEITHRWLLRCAKTWKDLSLKFPSPDIRRGVGVRLFGIIQGGYHKDLRRESAKFIADLDLPGIALGGETIGYYMDETLEVLDWVRDLLPKNKPLYTMGLGSKPSDLKRAFAAGVDMADCVAPTRIARHGILYSDETETINISKAIYKTDSTPIELNSPYTRAYLHHLFKTNELLYYRLASIHNLKHMLNFRK